MPENNNKVIDSSSKGISLKNILLVLKKRFVLILAIIFLFTAGGLVFSLMQKPTYTARELIKLTAEYQFINGKGEVQTSDNRDFSIMLRYIDSFIDFCDEGVVVDRANYYYVEYLNLKNKQSDLDVETYVEKLRSGAIQDNYYPHVSKDAHISNKNIKIAVPINNVDEEDLFVFNFYYTDVNKTDAYEKTKIYCYAYEKELASEDNAQGLTIPNYFGSFKVTVKDLGTKAVSSNSSKKKTVISAAIVGVVVSLLVVYIITKADKTIKSKEDLEHIVDAPVLSCLTK